MTKEQLIEDYKIRIATLNKMILEIEEDGEDWDKLVRFRIKRSCYQTFVTELERLEDD